MQTDVPPPVAGAKPVTVEHIKVHGTALEGNLERDAVDRDVFVFLPPSYAQEKSRRYPVVYALHGYSIGAEQRVLTFARLSVITLCVGESLGFHRSCGGTTIDFASMIAESRPRTTAISNSFSAAAQNDFADRLKWAALVSIQRKNVDLTAHC